MGLISSGIVDRLAALHPNDSITLGNGGRSIQVNGVPLLSTLVNGETLEKFHMVADKDSVIGLLDSELQLLLLESANEVVETVVVEPPSPKEKAKAEEPVAPPVTEPVPVESEPTV